MAKSKYARDPSYGKPPNWSEEYGKYFPEHTDPWSRHAKMIADQILRDFHSPVRRLLIDEGYEPDHWASAIEATVKSLWIARAEISRLTLSPDDGGEHDQFERSIGYVG